jgi:sugar phosphate isomerase/epimerase
MIGIASVSFCLVPFERMLEEVAEHFQLWEVLSEGESRLERARDGIRYGRDSLGMEFQVHAPLTDVNIGSVHEPMRMAALNEIKQTIMMCRQLDIPMVTIHPGFVQGIAFLDRSKTLVKTKESVKELASFAKEHSVEAVLENLPANINAVCTHADELIDVIGDTGLGMCFDIGHANTAGQVDEFLKHVGLFRNVHIHNNEGQWDQHNRIDDGSADLGRVLGALKGNYSGNIIIESLDLESGAESKAILERKLR